MGESLAARLVVVASYPAVLAIGFALYAALMASGLGPAPASYLAVLAGAGLVTLHEARLPHRRVWHPSTRDIGADRIELYTAPYAMAKTETEVEHEFGLLKNTALKAMDLGLGINAGHDLNLDNLPLMQELPGLLEVSIGHHLMADALYIGMEAAVKAYRQALGQQVR